MKMKWKGKSSVAQGSIQSYATNIIQLEMI